MSLLLFVSIFAGITVSLVLYFLFVPRNTGTVSNSTGMVGVLADDLYQSLPKGVFSLHKKRTLVEKVLQNSGNPWNINNIEFSIISILSAIVGVIFGGILSSLLYVFNAGFFVPLFVYPVLFGFIGLFFPILKHKDKANSRNEEFIKELPACLDLLIVSTLSGQSFASALNQCVPYMRPSIVRDCFDNMRFGLASGKTMNTVLDEFALQTPNDSVKTFTTALTEANSLNTPIVETLQSRAQASRQEYHSFIKNKASVLETKMRMSLLATMLPALLITTISPSLISLLGSLSSTNI